MYGYGIIPLLLVLFGALILAGVLVASHTLGLILLIVGVVLLLAGGGYVGYGGRRGPGGPAV